MTLLWRSVSGGFGALAEEPPVRRLVVARHDLLQPRRPVGVPSVHADGQCPADRADEPVHSGDVLSRLLEYVHDAVPAQHALK